MSTPTTRPEQTESARLETARAIYFAWITLAATTLRDTLIRHGHEPVTLELQCAPSSGTITTPHGTCVLHAYGNAMTVSSTLQRPTETSSVLYTRSPNLTTPAQLTTAIRQWLHQTYLSDPDAEEDLNRITDHIKTPANENTQRQQQP